MRSRTILLAAAPVFAGVALFAAGVAAPTSAQTPPQPAQAQPGAQGEEFRRQAPADASAQREVPADCPNLEEAGAPVVDEATARQHEGITPAPGRDLPEGKADTRDTIGAPDPGALSNRAATEQVETVVPCPPSDETSELASDPEVLESMEPGITELGRSPPNILLEESTLGLQQLIDRAHGGSTGVTRPGGGTRQVEGQPATLRDGSAPRERIAPQ